MFHVSKMSQKEITEKTGFCRAQVYNILHTFEDEYLENVLTMPQNQDKVLPSDYKRLMEEIKSLKRQLKDERLRADFYEEMVAYGKEVYGIDLKKTGTK